MTKACVPVCLIVLAALGLQAGWAADAAQRTIGGEAQLFVDDAFVAAKSGVVRRAHACEKLTAPVLEPGAPWEQDGDDQRVYVYGTVMRDAETGRFRMWYNRLGSVLYATSDDGLRWDRPNLGLVEWEGSRANNIVLTGFHSPGVVYNPEADSNERYAMLGSSKGYRVAFSADGLHWKPYGGNPVFTGGDTCTLTYDAASGEYLAFHKRTLEHRGHKRRMVYLATSRDMRNWSKQTLVMAPDDVDDAQVKREGGQYAQFYNMSAFPYGGQFLGMVTRFRYSGPPEREGPLQSSHDGPIDVQLVHSRDGRAWQRGEDRSPVIPNGPHAYDAGCILGVANAPVVVGDELWLYYTAITTTHGGFVPEKRITVALAKWRLDGFVSLDAGDDPGVVKTVPLECAGDRLTVNADAAGALTVAVLDAAGDPISGYAHRDCNAVTGDSVRHAVSWRQHEDLPTNRPLRLEFRMRNTQLFSYAVADEAADRVSKPFTYSGYAAAEYKTHRTLSAYVPMTDGAKLAADVFLPDEGPGQGPFPVILQYTPYRRARIDRKTERISDLSGTEAGRFFLPRGYAMVCADMRGTGASTGWICDFMPQLADDGKELVDWIAAQPWCDGNVGMMGDSYLGWSQIAVASRNPAALKCIVPGVVPLDGYTGELRPGGIYLQEFFKLWGGWMEHILRNRYIPDAGIIPAKPVVDEDGDGDLADEIPLDTNGNGCFLDEEEPTYSDGNTREHIYYRATMEHHKGNYDYAAWASKLPFIDGADPLGNTMYDLNPGAGIPAIMESGIPMYHVGGWFDAFTRGTFELFCTMRESNPSKLLMPPSYHDFNTGPFWEHFGYDPGDVLQLSLTEHLRFFDRYLKGVRNGIDEEPPIWLYVMNGPGWRFENEWPPARARTVAYFLNEDNALTRDKGAPGTDAYTADFTHSSTYAENGGNRYKGIAMDSPATVPTRTDKAAQCQVYTSEILSDPMEVTGHPIVRLWVSSSADYGDFFVYLEDVDEEGEAILVTEGQLRAGFAALHDNDKVIDSGAHGIDVLPDLPWHGFEQADYQDAPFAGGAVLELVIDFQPTAWVFRQGHRVRLSIACADCPTFALHPGLSPKNDPDAPDNSVPTVTFHRTAEFPSRLELPWIPE
jgi:uncharacterized protein